MRPLTNGFGLFSTEGGSCGNGLQLSGSNIVINGGIRSNGNVMVQGSTVNVSGKISYGGTKDIGSNVTSGGVVYSAPRIEPTYAWKVSDFAPGAKYSTVTGYVSHNGQWTIGATGATRGLHYVKGDVVISGSAPDLVGVTIVATGSVTISGGSVITPTRTDLPTILAGGGSWWNSAINLSGNSISWTGVLAAPNGVVAINGSKLRGGSILAGNIQMSGSDIQIG